MNDFLSGAILMGFLVCCMFFLRSHRQTGDRLFLHFALAMAFFTLERLILGGHIHTVEQRPAVYALRLLGFCMIIRGILAKNSEAPQ